MSAIFNYAVALQFDQSLKYLPTLSDASRWACYPQSRTQSLPVGQFSIVAKVVIELIGYEALSSLAVLLSTGPQILRRCQKSEIVCQTFRRASVVGHDDPSYAAVMLHLG
jgi:hypothetical protein